MGEGKRLRVLRRIFLPKRDEMILRWRNLYNEEFHNLYFSASIISMTKPRTVGWAVENQK
jgi:hypothetical protein